MKTKKTKHKIHNPKKKKIDQIVQQMAKDGVEKLHILADFDSTLTRSFVNGIPTPSIGTALRKGNFLTPDYTAKANALYDHYSKIERDPSVPKEEKKKIMNEWWRKSFKLLKDSGLSKKNIERATTSGEVQYRPRALEFIDRLHEHNIPLVIMSASTVGADGIAAHLKHNNSHKNNIHIISNSFIWDEDGKVLGVNEPIITGMNKDETLIQNFPAFEVVKNRKNVILLGDNIGDVGMVEGFDYENLLKIGFLNEDPAGDLLPEFEKHYDAVILDDGPFDFVNSILEKIIS